MAAIDFPDNPTIGETFTVGIRTWTWDGAVWRVSSFGRFGPPGVKIDDTPPDNTEILWIDTEEPGSAVLPTGGTTGQVLAKLSNSNYDTTWSDGPISLGYGDIDGGSSNSWYSWLDLKVDNSDASAIILDGSFVNGGSAVN
jgi:hypothetical protein